MLNDIEIERLISKALERQRKLNTDVLTQIMSEVNNIQSHTIQTLFRANINYKAIEQELYLCEQDVVSMIFSTIRTVGEDAYLSAKDMYEFRGIYYPTLAENMSVADIILTNEKIATNTYRNAMKKACILVPLQSGMILPTPLMDAVSLITDRAKQSVFIPTIHKETFNSKLINDLTNSELRTFVTPSNKNIATQKLDTVLENNLKDSIRDTEIEVGEEVGVQVDADGIELSAHLFPAPDHAPVQGHQFTTYNFQLMQTGYSFSDIQNREYAGFERPIGAWNCRHTIKPIIVGNDKQRYTDKQLQIILDENEKGYTTKNGTHMTMYDCIQRKKLMERNIRHLELSKKMAQSVHDENLTRKYHNQLVNKKLSYVAFCKATNLDIDLT